MPRTEIEFLSTKTVTVDERITVVVDVPQHVLDKDQVALHQWVEEQFMNSDTELSREANEEANVTVEDESEDYEINEVSDLGPHD